MEKKIMAAAATAVATAAVVMFALGGCVDSSVGENEALFDEGASDSVGVVTANDVTEAATENVTEAGTESVTEVTTESVTDEAAAETEELKSFSAMFARKLEDESLTLTIDSDVYPYDCEYIEIDVDWETSVDLGVEAYKYIDLGNLKNYPNLKKLRIAGNMYDWNGIKLINCAGAAGLENLEEIRLYSVAWDEDWLSGIGSLKELFIGSCYDYDGEFLENMKQVETLGMFRCGVTDLSFINGMSSLTELSVKQSKLDNSLFDDVEENYSVKKLTISENNLADLEQQRQEVQASLPECEVKIYY